MTGARQAGWRTYKLPFGMQDRANNLVLKHSATDLPQQSSVCAFLYFEPLRTSPNSICNLPPL